MILSQWIDLLVMAVAITMVTDRLCLVMLFHLWISNYFGVISTKEPHQEQFLNQLIAFENKLFKLYSYLKTRRL